MTHPQVVRSVAALRSALGTTAPGFVATMGALHDGHAALIRRSAAENSQTVVSIFVNPTQFNDPADLSAYPRTLEADVDIAIEAGADLIWAPDIVEIYPPGFATTVSVGRLSERWEGECRPGHFQAVGTVVAVLLGAVQPARAYFGEKDYQQLAVIRQMVRDLRLPVEIVACPTIRETHGLALSSRNRRLSDNQRSIARAVPEALFRIANLAASGIGDVEQLLHAGRSRLAAEPELAVEYLAIVDPATLEPVRRVSVGSRAIVAVRLGDVRLIDNMELSAAMLAVRDE